VTGPSETESADLAAIKRDHPDWEFAYVRDLGVWMGLSRPTQTAEHVLVGRDLGELRTKLESQ
jgi:hypothetical protein